MNSELKICIDCNIYPMDAVKAAGYTFTDKVFVEIKKVSKTQAEVILKPKDSKFYKDKIKGEFLNELLHHAVRLKIAQNNDEIRKFIVTKALASSAPSGNKDTQNRRDCLAEQKKPVKPDKEMADTIESIAKEPDKDYKKDPAGIQVKWEDKNLHKS